MPIKRSGWELEITVEDVLFAQAADAAELSRRSPRLVDIAQKAIDDAYRLISPMVVYQEVAVEAFQREKINLHGGHQLTGSLVTKLLKGASTIIVAICTIGDALEKQASSMASSDLIYSFALDSVGSVAAEHLGDLACWYFEDQKKQQGLNTTIPINPGMIDWDLKEGQTEIFKILAHQNHGVQLSESGLMTPLKSQSLVLGAGHRVRNHGVSCDYCEFNGRCQFQKQGAVRKPAHI